ncbi:acyl carrier protein [Candidatus Parcubacteria bacterium]|nr:acyl carrier protein [Candidatus Parcubacteria bacterium]
MGEKKDRLCNEKELKEIIYQTGVDGNCKIDRNDIVPEADLKSDLGYDSLDIIEFIMRLEEKYDIDISDEDAEKFLTVEDIYNYIKTRVR